MGFFDTAKDKFFGRDPGIVTKTIDDPLKSAVASPLSAFLAGQIGKGLPRFEDATGKSLTRDFTDTEKSRFNAFLGQSAGDVFTESIADPSTKRFKEEFLPVIKEGFAGSLRGSGRFRAEEAGISQFSEALSAQRAAFIPEFQQKQVGVALALKEAEGRDYQIRYNDWLRSLPQFNPALQQAISFLNEGTGTGTTILSALDPGSEGFFGDLIKGLAIFGAAK